MFLNPEAAHSERLLPTLLSHRAALENGAAILRVHDVKEHREMLEIGKQMK
jgi:dihydropteroate synthase